MDRKAALYRTIWRWHFYAGLFVMPFILILSISGATYLFKPQIDRWEERAFIGLGNQGAVSPNAQADAALASFPGSSLHSYRLPREAGDAAMIHIGLADGRSMRDVFVSPQGKVLGSLDPDTRITPLIARFHGSLFAGQIGDWLVELAACWAIVMVVTGLYLWWPRGRGAAGVVWPRLTGGRNLFWRDLHAVTGFWVAGLALVLLVTGLPWAGVWGSAFRVVRAELGLISGPQNWKVGAGDQHAGHGHDHAAMMRDMHAAGKSAVSLGDMVAKAQQERMAFPVIILPPGAPKRFGPPNGMMWTVTSEAQNRPLIRSVSYAMDDGREVARSGFADKHIIDRIVNYGIAWHEGQLFGWANQLVGVMTALALITLTASGFVMWRRRKPDDALGAPTAPTNPARLRGVAVITLILAAMMPLLALSMLVVWLAERLVLATSARAAVWLGLVRA